LKDKELMVYPQFDMDALRNVLKHNSWFKDCPSELQDALLVHSRQCKLASGEALYRQGDAPDQGLYCVLDGAICIGSCTPGGAASMVVYLEPFHWFGDVSLIDGLERQQDAFADGPTTVLCIALQPISDWLADHPCHWRHIAKLSAYKLRVAYQIIAFPGALHQRLALRLWWMAHGFGSRPAETTTHIKVSQSILAQMLGTSRQSMNAALRELETRELIRLRHRRIDVMNLSLLLRHANAV
jgi:CRP/FNR family cyclic AMP-dependent transcriptional regulator